MRDRLVRDQSLNYEAEPTISIIGHICCLDATTSKYKLRARIAYEGCE